MKHGNTVTLKQLQDAITKNGFVMKHSYATVAGTVSAANAGAQLKVSGSNDIWRLVPESAKEPTPESMEGKSVVVTGTIPEAQKGKVPDAISYKSLMEEKQ